MTMTACLPTGTAVSVATDRGTLLDALAMVGLAVPGRPAVPVLGGVLLEASGGDLTLSATDYGTAVSVRLPGAATGTSRLLVGHAELCRLLGALSKGTGKRAADRLPVTLTAAGPVPVLGMAGYAVPLEPLPVEDYPSLPAVPPAVAVVDGAVFTAEAGRVLAAAETGASALPMLAGVRLEVTDGAVTLAATDRRRLAVARVPAVTGAGGLGAAGAVVAGAVLARLCTRLPGDAVRVGLDTDRTGLTRVSFSGGPVTVVTSSVSEEYPDYARFLPAASAGTVTAGRGRLLAQARRAAAVLAAKGVRDTAVAVRVGPGAVSVSPVLPGPAGGVSAPSLPARTEGIGGPVAYLFAPGLLADAVGSFTGDTLTAHLTGGPARPVLFTDTPAGLGDPAAFRHLLLPRQHPTHN